MKWHDRLMSWIRTDLARLRFLRPKSWSPKVWSRNCFRTWWPAILIACSILGFTATIAFGAYLINQRRQDNADRIARERAARLAERRQQRRATAQLSLSAYVLCRSTSRTPRQCNRIAAGIILPSKITVDQLEAEFGKIAELQVQRIFIKGQPGLQGRTGAQGPAGRNGAAGSRGAQGSEGRTGQAGRTGSRGARGPQGPPGAQGPQGPRGATGPPGAPGPGVTCKWVVIKIPSAGDFTVCTQ